MNETCTFCSERTLEWRTIHHDKLVRSFLSDPKLAPGHSLVVPNRHVVPPESLTDEEKIAVFSEAERLRAAMLGSFAIGADWFQKTRPNVAQGHNGTKVDHWHLHVLPSNPGEELYETSLGWGVRSNFSPLLEREADEMLEVLRR